MGFLFLSLVITALHAFETALPLLESSPAFKQFEKQPKSELAKLIFLLSRFKEAKTTVIYDSREYTAAEASRLAKDYLVRHYHKETADYWIRKYCYKTDSGNLIQLKGADSEMRPALEFSLAELKALEGKTV